MFQSLIKHLFLLLSCREFDRYFYTINFEYSVFDICECYCLFENGDIWRF